jgi:hypothetical protein
MAWVVRNLSATNHDNAMPHQRTSRWGQRLTCGETRTSAVGCCPVAGVVALIRMRSQVQVVAGPPPIPTGHSAAGNRPGAPAASRGRVGAARPSAGTPTGPSGPSTPGGRHHDHHPPWSPTQPRTAATRPLRPPRAAARCVPTARPPATALRTPARPGSHRHRLRWDAWDEMDASGRTGGQQPPGRLDRRTRTTEPLGEHHMVDVDRRQRPTATRRLDASPGSRRLREQQPRTAQQQGRRGTTLLRTGLTTAATVSCWWYATSSWRLGALLSSDDDGSSVERQAHGQVVWRGVHVLRGLLSAEWGVCKACFGEKADQMAGL